MKEPTTVNLTLEFTIHTDSPDDLDINAEAMLQGAVRYTPLNAMGTGYSYSYCKKRSRRGMTVKAPVSPPKKQPATGADGGEG